MTSAALAVIGTLAASLLFSGCQDVVWIDPEVTFAPRDDNEVVGEFSLTLGEYDEQLFTPLTEGDDVPVVYGFQGGTWIMPALRCTGVTEVVQIGAELRLDDGELLGLVAPYEVRLDRTPDGSLDANSIPVPVIREDFLQPLDAVFGRRATLRLDVTDAKQTTGSVEVDITLIEG